MIKNDLKAILKPVNNKIISKIDENHKIVKKIKVKKIMKNRCSCRDSNPGCRLGRPK